MSKFYDDDSADNILKEITENLSKQVMEEMDDKSLLNPLPSMDQEPGKAKKGKPVKKILISVAAVLLVLIVGAALAGNYFLGRINYEKEEDIEIIKDDTVNKEEKPIKTVDVKPADSNVINVLLIGEEKMKDTVRGRSDSMMIATINQTQKSLKLTSLLRDCYVSIPEHGQGKLNSAYNIGGGPLLLQTIEQNFQIHLDGYARVDFEGFETIIDMLGGVDIEITEGEANYLNRPDKDYITEESNKTLVPGVNKMNGDQALGYARIRYVKGIGGESDDFGRTNRQRIVLNAIFEEYKSSNLVELVAMTNELFPYIYTNLSKTDILSYVAAAVGTGMTGLETLRLPLDNEYYPQRMGKSGEVLMVNFEKNCAAFNEFIYGAGIEPENGGPNTEQAAVSVD